VSPAGVYGQFQSFGICLPLSPDPGIFIYCNDNRRGRIEPALASRLSTLLVNHRSMLEVALLEKQIEEMRQLLASERAIPLPILTARNG
jgi:hypothetical protein